MVVRPRVYVAGPYTTVTQHSQAQNIAHAIDAADQLVTRGCAPMVPHLMHAWEIKHAYPYDVWLDICLSWVRAADAVYRLPGESSGADKEVALAKQIGTPVFHSVSDCGIWARGFGGYDYA